MMNGALFHLPVFCFYGLALINASKYTVTDIRYLGYCQIILGLVNMFFIGYGLYFGPQDLGCFISCMD